MVISQRSQKNLLISPERASGKHMQMQKNNEYLLKAIDAFRKRFFVISTEFEILAINQGDGKEDSSIGSGKKCFETFFGQNEACGYCPAKQIFLSREPVMWEADKDTSGEGRGSCLYAYPIISGETIEAVAIMDFRPPHSGGTGRKTATVQCVFPKPHAELGGWGHCRRQDRQGPHL